MAIKAGDVALETCGSSRPNPPAGMLDTVFTRAFARGIPPVMFGNELLM